MREIKDFADKIEEYVPGISMDCVLLGYGNGALQVLLLKWANSEAWSLPGGFLKQSEEMEQAVQRVLEERTGIQEIFLSQFHTFSGVNRSWLKDSRDQQAIESTFEKLAPDAVEKIKNWFAHRFITTGFLAMVDMNMVNPVPDLFTDECRWFPIHELPHLILDHKEIINRALQELRTQLNYLPIGKALLPERFTMKDLQSLYQEILEKKLDRGNFQRKILALNMLERHEKLMTGAANKAPYLYSFNEKIYLALLRDGIGFSAG